MLKKEKLEILYEETCDCVNCKLSTTRKNYVFGEGNPDADIMFIGEAPGREEDEIGRPFVGRSGKLLTGIIENGMQIKREDVYISNIVKCRPTINLEGKTDRKPEKDEINNCCFILEKQIEIIKPKVIITLGNPATRFMLNTKQGITKIHGIFGEYKNIKVMPIYHPSYVLRNGGEKSPLKKDVWEDIKKVLKYLKEI
jgi:DNA polymerase